MPAAHRHRGLEAPAVGGDDMVGADFGHLAIGFDAHAQLGQAGVGPREIFSAGPTECAARLRPT